MLLPFDKYLNFYTYSKDFWLYLFYDFVILTTRHEHIVACTAVSRERLGKHAPAGKDTHPKTRVLLLMVRAEDYNEGDKVLIRSGGELEHGSRRIAIVRSHYQETSSEDTAGWKTLSVCCSSL
jgi:hypothetical protein